MNLKFNTVPLLLFYLVLSTPIIFAQTNLPRTIITTDGEIDDVDSFIRMLLYANEFKIEGLIYSSSMWHYKGDGKGTKFLSEMDMTKRIYGERTDLRWPGTQWMEGLLDQYEKVYPHLELHDKQFPTADYLRSKIRIGNIDFEGEMDYDTEGSNFIKKILLDENAKPIFLQAWGGTNTIARALKSIEDQNVKTSDWEKLKKRISEKSIIYTILDQDATYKKYIASHWPDIKIIYNSRQFGCLAYNWKKVIPDSIQYLFEGKYMSENIIHNHGPLLDEYYSYGDGKHQDGDEHIHGDPTKIKNGQWGSFDQYDFISEGDSPAFLYLVNVGLGNLYHPELGGWGGRFVQSSTIKSRWEDGSNATDQSSESFPQVRWLEAIQNDMAARADWCVEDYKHANHAPVIVLKQKSLVHIGKKLKQSLKASAIDPDGNKLYYKWWYYPEAGNYQGKVLIKNANLKTSKIELDKKLEKNGSIHMIVEVIDNGIHPMTRYQRVVLTY